MEGDLLPRPAVASARVLSGEPVDDGRGVRGGVEGKDLNWVLAKQCDRLTGGSGLDPAGWGLAGVEVRIDPQPGSCNSKEMGCQ